MDNKRISVKMKTPNPLFVKWLTEWKEKAKLQDSKMQYTFKLALQSLQKYPVPLQSGRECKILKGFGEKLCLMLDNKLKEYKNSDKNLNSRASPISACSAATSITNQIIQKENFNDTKTTKKSIRKSEEYIPQYRSGAYAILVALYQKSQEPEYEGFVKKEAIIEAAQFLTDSSFTKPMPGSRYTSWSSMRTLISKELVVKESNPPKFYLTEQGRTLAGKLFERAKLTNDLLPKFDSGIDSKPSSSKNNDLLLVDNVDTVENTYELNKQSFCSSTNISNNNQLINKKQDTSSKLTVKKSKSKTLPRSISSSSTVVTTQSSLEQETFIFLPNSFDIILYVDMQEVSGKVKKYEGIIRELEHLAVIYEVKHLKVGDFTWICRDRDTKKELVLPYIVERKRMDDFGSSIKDGRYYEQKFRLKKSGIENVIYLIESYGKNDTHLGLPFRTLMQAATNTAIQDFFVKFTANLGETAQYLANFSNMLTKLFQYRTVVSCPKENLSPLDFDDDLLYLMPFEEFNKSSLKNKRPKVSDLFVKILIQIKGMSVDRALAVVEKYPTPSLLHQAYEANNSVQGEKLLAGIKYGLYNKTIGAVLSKTVHQLFTKHSFIT